MNKSDILALFQHYPLLDKNLADQVTKISELFGFCSNNFIFEMPLEGNESKVDFSLCIRQEEAGQLLDYWEKEELKPIFYNPNWETIKRFCSEWRSLYSPVRHNIRDVWYEFDNHQLDMNLPNACFFFSPVSLRKKSSRENDKENVDTDWLFNSVLVTLFKKYFSEEVKRNLVTCVDQLPRKGVIFQIGIMIPRGFNGLRLCTSMSIDNYIPYLERIGWTGSYGNLEKILNTLYSYVDALFVDIDIEENIYQSLGIECCYAVAKETILKLEKFLHYLLSCGLCTKEKAGFILSWCNHNDTAFQNTVSHIKIVLPPSQVSTAKVYLAVSKSSR